MCRPGLAVRWVSGEATDLHAECATHEVELASEGIASVKQTCPGRSRDCMLPVTSLPTGKGTVNSLPPPIALRVSQTHVESYARRLTASACPYKLSFPQSPKVEGPCISNLEASWSQAQYPRHNNGQKYLVRRRIPHPHAGRMQSAGHGYPGCLPEGCAFWVNSRESLDESEEFCWPP